MEIRFIHIPVRTISLISNFPEPKTTALGGVATGSIKAQEAAKVALTIKSTGSMPKATAMEAKIGNSMAVVAKLEVSSVKKFTEATMINIIRNRESPCITVI